MPLTEKQTDYIRLATHRWNFKVGAARAGKTFCDFYLIPIRIRRCPKDGVILLMGHTVGTLCRNLLDPMRQIWGESLVEQTGSKSDTVMLFGRKCYLLGADKISAVEKLQGCSVAYCYGDEVSTWSEEVFSMLKSRLDKPGACFDGTCNPAHPTHWLKRFLDSGADLFIQNYVMDDNPFLSEEYLRNIKAEYAGTVWYDRLILGKWVAAEGVIYRAYANDPEHWRLREEKRQKKKLQHVTVGVDFGGTKSGTSFVAVGFTVGFEEAIVLRSERHAGELDATLLAEHFFRFLAELRRLTALPISVFCDSAEPILIRTLKKALLPTLGSVQIKLARKGALRERIRLTLSLMASGRFLVCKECDSLEKALCEAVWDPKSAEDVRLDDGSTDIDSLDAMEYALEPFASRLLRSALFSPPPHPHRL